MENSNTNTNPLLSVSKLTDQAVPFDQIKTEHFLPAIKQLIEEAKAKTEAIANNPEAPTFENTIEAGELAGLQLNWATTIFMNLKSCHTNDEINSMAGEVSQLVSEYSSFIFLNQKYFERVKQVYDTSSDLTGEKRTLLDKAYKAFTRNGALLNDADKKKLKSLDQELASLSPEFGNNSLKAMNAFTLNLTSEDDVQGLPESALEGAKELAQSREESGWTFSLHFPSYLPFMQYADNRAHRETLFKAMSSKAYKDEFDNSKNVLEITRLKKERARLLGYDTHAHFTLEERMAKTPETVIEFLDKLYDPSYEAAKKDLADVQKLADELGGPNPLQPWDYHYYQEKLKEKTFAFNSEELRPYFKLENCVEGAFEHARRLYGIDFKEADVPVYHPDVKAYEVTEIESGNYIGLFYTDFFPRASKRAGAWMTLYREQGWNGDTVERPHVSIVCNFAKPTETKPSLLTFNSLRTLFHEFGHALHGLLSQCHYKTLAGTNVYWDFVELPSQVMENWILEKEGLEIFAKHFETGETIPDTMIQKIKDSANFQAGYASLRQLRFGYLDMAWYYRGPMSDDVGEFEELATEKANILPVVEGTNSSCSFGHIFAGGYSAGYYSYKWAEVLDADAFELFLEKGIFDRDTAQKFKENVLERGGSQHPMDLYKKFRGREPNPDALLKRNGLI